MTLDSDLEFPELATSSASACEVLIRKGRVDFTPSSAAPARVLYKPLPANDVIVYYAGVGSALVRNGSAIVYQPAKGNDPQSLRLFILQQVLGVALLQRRKLVLHASAATFNGRAVAFCGPSGQGKSTLVAALTTAGFSILTDDVLAVDMSDKNAMALPGLMQLKLTEEARNSFAQSAAKRSIGNRSSKSLCEVIGPRPAEASSLSEIYILETGTSLILTPIPQARATIELVRHTYGSRLLQATGLSSDYFERTVSLARQIAVTALSRPRDLSLLPEIVAHIKRRLLSPVPTAFESGVR